MDHTRRDRLGCVAAPHGVAHGRFGHRRAAGTICLYREATCASICLIHADLGALLTLSLRGSEKFSPFWNEQASLGVERRRVMRDPVVVNVIPVLEHFEKACTCEHIDAAASRIVEEIVRNEFRRAPSENYPVPT